MISIAQETLGFRRQGFSPCLSLLMPAYSLPLPPAVLTVDLQQHLERSPTALLKVRPVSSVICLAPLHFRRKKTRPVSCYALFKGVAASKPTSWLSVLFHILFHSAYILGP